MENGEYSCDRIAELDLFQKKVKAEGHDWLKNVLNDRWFDGIRTNAEIVWSGLDEKYNGDYFPYRWLGEEEEWGFINEWFYYFADKTSKKQILRTKLKRLTSHDWMEGLTTALEIKLGCIFSRDDVFVEIDHKVNETKKQNADFLIRIDQRDILVEATATTVGLVNPLIKFGAISVTKMENQIKKKIKEKAEVQLNDTDKPTVLIISLPPFHGADHFTAKWAIDKCFPQYPQLSAIIIADSYLFKYGAWYVNPYAKYPLNNHEKRYISNLLLLNGNVRKYDLVSLKTEEGKDH